jgi:hypothetical protein
MHKRFALFAVALICAALVLPQFAVASTFINFNVTTVNGNVGNPTAVNKWGTVVGYYSSDGGYDGFLWKTSGSVTTIVFPKMTITKAMGVNDSGSVVGYYQSRTGDAIHGFLRNPRYIRRSTRLGRARAAIRERNRWQLTMPAKSRESTGTQTLLSMASPSTQRGITRRSTCQGIRAWPAPC